MSTSTLDYPTTNETLVDDPRSPDSDWDPSAQNDFSGNSTSKNGFTPKGRRKSSIGKLEVAELTSQLAIMTQSGVDLASAISSLASQCQRPALAEILEDVREAVLAGCSFSDALSNHPTIFGPTFTATVAAGEASGRMSEVLQQLASMQKNEIQRRREIRSLLTYPILLLVVSGSVLNALILFVLPQFTEIFAQYDMPLPIITRFFLAIADELSTRWWLWGTLVASVLVGFFIWRKTPGGRSLLDRFWIQGAVIGEIYCGMCIGETCRLLGLMLENGVPLLESLGLTRQAMTNLHYKNLLDQLEESVINGQNLACILQQSEVVPASAKEMLVTAESTGNLNTVTTILGEYYEEESAAKLRQLVGILEPAITVGMGAIVAVVVLAVMLPVFDLSTFASGGQ